MFLPAREVKMTWWIWLGIPLLVFLLMEAGYASMQQSGSNAAGSDDGFDDDMADEGVGGVRGVRSGSHQDNFQRYRAMHDLEEQEKEDLEEEEPEEDELLEYWEWDDDDDWVDG